MTNQPKEKVSRKAKETHVDRDFAHTLCTHTLHTQESHKAPEAGIIIYMPSTWKIKNKNKPRKPNSTLCGKDPPEMLQSSFWVGHHMCASPVVSRR